MNGTERVEIWGIPEIQAYLGCGRPLAERYARDSGALLPRVKGGAYKIKKKVFCDWLQKGAGR